MSDPGVISIRGLRTSGRLGCTAEERSFPQVLVFEIEMSVNFAKCIRTDSVSDAVDYMAVVGAAEDLLKGREWKLLETLVADLAQTLLERFSLIERIEISAEKSVHANPRAFAVRYAKSR